MPGGQTHAVRVVADGDRLVCFGDDGLSDVPEGTGLFASVRGLACGPLEKYFRVRLLQLAPDDCHRDRRPRRRQFGFGAIDNPIRVMRLEHVEEDTHLHIHKENNVLFPMAAALQAGGS